MYIHYIGSEATDARIWCQGKDIALDLHKTPGQRQPHSCGAIVDGRRALGRVSSRRPYAFPTIETIFWLSSGFATARLEVFRRLAAYKLSAVGY